MKITPNITDVMRVGDGWAGVSNPKKPSKRNPWFGLTPEEAYKKGKRDAMTDLVLRELDRKMR
jgi:hypothetical protein